MALKGSPPVEVDGTVIVAWASAWVKKTVAVTTCLAMHAPATPLEPAHTTSAPHNIPWPSAEPRGLPLAYCSRRSVVLVTDRRDAKTNREAGQARVVSLVLVPRSVGFLLGERRLAGRLR